MLTVTDITIGAATFSIGTLAVCTGLVLIGYQSMWFGSAVEVLRQPGGPAPG